MKKCIIQISSGKGPRECDWVVTQLKNVFIKNVLKNDLQIIKINEVYDNKEELLVSVQFTFYGEEEILNAFTESWIGTIQWIGQSPIRKNHKRKNWFVKVTEHSLNEVPSFSFDKNDMLVETFRASGNGGQNVNKLETAIRLTHKPTGAVAISKDERSQYRNKQTALKRLEQRLKQLQTEETDIHNKSLWQNHNSIERGNAKRIFKGLKFKEVK